MKNYTLEVCIDSVESALAAVEGGATRLEMCANLVIGGTTPSVFLYREIRKHSNIPIHAIIRPRFGDFCYSTHELRIMTQEVEQFKAEGADGVVIGALQPDGSLDMATMEALCRASGGMNIALHRAFDMCKDPFETLNQVEALGIGTILTSGQQNHCLDGAGLIKELALRNQADIMVGGGVNADVIRKLREKTGITSYHLSGKTVINSPMQYRNPNVSMGLPSLGEYEMWRTCPETIAAAKKALEGG